MVEYAYVILTFVC